MEESLKRYILESFREKYHRAGKKGKGTILKGVCEALTCHRKHAVRLMRKQPPGRKPQPGKRGRKSKYDTPEFLRALHRVRKVMEFRNAEVMKENMAEWLPFIENHYGSFAEDIKQKLLIISASTMKRYFHRSDSKLVLVYLQHAQDLRFERKFRYEQTVFRMKALQDI